MVIEGTFSATTGHQLPPVALPTYRTRSPQDAPEPRVFGARAGEPRHRPNCRGRVPMSNSAVLGHTVQPGGDPIYKVMSRQRLPPSDDELDAYVFGRRSSSVARADWNASGAYTKLEPSTGWPPFVLRNRLFYANMESPVSCMETQRIIFAMEELVGAARGGGAAFVGCSFWGWRVPQYE